MVTIDGIRTRTVRPDDADALVFLFGQWGHAQSAEAIVAVLAEWRRTPHAEVVVAEVDGDLAGVVAVLACLYLDRPGRFARLAGLVVSATHRRQGVGANLLAVAEHKAREWGCDRLELTSSRSRAEAHAFYPANGYEDQSHRHARYVRQL